MEVLNRKNVFLRAGMVWLLAFILTFSGSVGINAQGYKHESVLFQKENEITCPQRQEKGTLIVELDAPSLVERYSLRNQGYKSFSLFAKSASGERTEDAIERSQEGVKKQVEAITGTNAKVSFTRLLSGFALEGSQEDIKKIAKIPGVKNVFLERHYALVEPVKENIPQVIHSVPYIGAKVLQESGYTGKGTAVAIIDTGLDLDHNAFTNAFPLKPKYSKNDIERIIRDNKMKVGKLSSSVVYKGPKVPFAFDYAGNDYNVATGVGHGSHVAGIVAGNGSEIKGVAPDAQLVIMKVFGDKGGGASETAIISALEDAVTLGVDAINMSLGMDAGFSVAGDETTARVYNGVKDAGIHLLVAAGNNNSSYYHVEPSVDFPKPSFPDNGIVASPSTYDASMSVASINNKSVRSYYFEVNGRKIPYIDSEERALKMFLMLTGNASLEYVPVGEGLEESYKDIDVKDKIALVKRGGMLGENPFTFAEKERIAADHGAIGMVVYDNAVGEIPKMVTTGRIPSVAISKSMGEYMLNQTKKELLIPSGNFTDIPDEFGGRMSDFSSWGPTPDLKIKPEITAPGGNIYSAYLNGRNKTLSGTSMAAPHVSGAFMVLHQAMMENEDIKNLDKITRRNLEENVLMSTAIPQKDQNEIYYSPRKQGAGLLNINRAVKTKTYLSNLEGGKPKLELGGNEQGHFQLKFNVISRDDRERVYRVKPIVLTEALREVAGKQYMAQAAEPLTEEDVIIKGPGTVKVSPGETKEIEVSLDLTEKGKKKLAVFDNGIYIDGFVLLEGGDKETIPLSIPFLGFYGDWTKQPAFDKDIYSEEEPARFATLLGISNGSYDSEYARLETLGNNAFLKKGMKGKYDRRKLAISKINEKFNPHIDTFSLSLGLLRNMESLTYQLTDAKGVVHYKNTDHLIGKSTYDKQHHAVLPAGDSGNWLEKLPMLPAGHYIYSIEGKYLNSDKKEMASYDIFLDDQKPELTKYELIKKADGSRWLRLHMKDNHYLQGYMILGPESDKEKYVPETAILHENEGEEVVRELRLDQGVLSDKEKVRVALIDYANNESISLPVSLKEPFIQEKQSPKLKAIHMVLSSSKLKIGEEAELQLAKEPTDAEGDIRVECSDVTKAEILHEEGSYKVKAIGVGKVSIKAICGDVSKTIDLEVVKAEKEQEPVPTPKPDPTPEPGHTPEPGPTPQPDHKPGGSSGTIPIIQPVQPTPRIQQADVEQAKEEDVQKNAKHLLPYLNGYPDGTIRPEKLITRGELVTILYEAYGSKSQEGTRLTDTESHWAKNAIAWAVTNQWVQGYPDGSFKPDKPMTRAEIVSVLMRDQSAVRVKSNVLNDIEGHWAQNAIQNALDAGYIQGYPDGSFKPQRALTRAEAVCILNRYFKLSAKDGKKELMYTDLPQSHWAYAEFLKACK